MKKYFIIILLLVFAIVGCGKRTDYRTKEQLAKDAKYEWLFHKNEYKSIELYKKAIDKEDNDNKFDAKISLDIAYRYYVMKQYQEAITTYKKALNYDPEVEKLYDYNLYLGTSLKEIGEYDDAILKLNKAIEINPDESYPYMNLWSIYSKLDNKELEKKYWDIYYKTDNSKSKDNSFSSSSNIQSEFENWLYNNTAVIEVHFESDWQIWVTLESYKYTSESNVEEIAEDIARWYAQRMNKSFTVCTVWKGDDVYAKGNYNR